MARRARATRRRINGDPVYGSENAARLINKVMTSGRKSIAERVFYKALDVIGEKTRRDPIEVVDLAVRNTLPLLEVRPRRVGGATYQVPMEVRPERRLSMAVRWLISFARARQERTMVERLAGELMDAANNTGSAVRKKEEVHRMAEANKAFAHYRW